MLGFASAPWCTAPSRARALVWFVAAVSTALAQDSNVQTCQEGLSWMVNSKGQTPCLLAAYLRSQCRPFRVDAIPVGTYYSGPVLAEADECACSTVTYSLISACGACQDRRWNSWRQWSANCTTSLVSIGQPFPKGVPPAAEIPAWAWLDVTQQPDQAFNIMQAIQAGTAPLPITSSTSSSTSTPTSVTTSQTPVSNNPTETPPAATSANSTGSSKSKAGAIAGGVVGGVVALVAIALLTLWFILRKRRKQVPKDFVVDEMKTDYGGLSHQRSDSQGVTLNAFSPPPGSSTLPSLYGVQPMNPHNGPPSYYTSGPMDMSDTNSVPMSPSSAVYTTLPGRRSFESLTQSQPSQFGSLVPVPNRGGGYTGAAELS